MTTVLEHPDLTGLTDDELGAAYFDPGADLDAIDAEHKHRAAIRSARRQANAARTRARSEPWRELAEPQYERAEAECSYLLNRRGIAAGMQPWPALWTGPWHNAEPYMSEELIRWFERPGNERITVTEYQRQEAAQRRAYEDEHDASEYMVGRDDEPGSVRRDAADGQGAESSRERGGFAVPRPDPRAAAQAGQASYRPVRDAGHVQPGRHAMSPAAAELRARADAIRAGVPYAAQPAAEPVPLLSPAPGYVPGQVAVRERGTVARERRQDIDGAKVLGDVRTFLGYFAWWPSEASLDAVALWCAHAHARKADGMLVWQASPRLLFQSAEPGSGKSWAMRLTARICPAPAVFTEPSEPAVAHAIGKEHATLFLDEIDVLFGRGNRKAAIRAVINDGYTPDGSWARVRGGQVDRIPTFGALALAGLESAETSTDGHLKALFTRVIKISMRRGPDGWRPPRFDDRGRRAATLITEKLGQWAAQSLAGLGDYVPEMPGGIGNRQAELWEPLLAVADAAGGRWPEAARIACEELVNAGAVPDDDDAAAEELDGILAGWGDES